LWCVELIQSKENTLKYWPPTAFPLDRRQSLLFPFEVHFQLSLIGVAIFSTQSLTFRALETPRSLFLKDFRVHEIIQTLRHDQLQLFVRTIERISVFHGKPRFNGWSVLFNLSYSSTSVNNP
jgi:hypothetical protein